MTFLYTEILYRPLFNLLVFLYNTIPGSDFGVAILALTLLVKIVLFPLTYKTVKSQKALNKLAPEIQSIKEKYKNDRTAQSAAIMELYKKYSINPLSGCLPLIIQLPILIALYQAFLAGFNPEKLQLLYSFVSNPGVINKLFLGFLDITQKSPVLAVLAGLAQAIQAKKSMSYQPASGGNKELAAMSKQMLYFFPVMIIIIGWNLPAGLMLYWISSTLFSALEQWYIQKKVN